jgi:hypothetical protein
MVRQKFLTKNQFCALRVVEDSQIANSKFVEKCVCMYMMGCIYSNYSKLHFCKAVTEKGKKEGDIPLYARMPLCKLSSVSYWPVVFPMVSVPIETPSYYCPAVSVVPPPPPSAAVGANRLDIC